LVQINGGAAGSGDLAMEDFGVLIVFDRRQYRREFIVVMALSLLQSEN
jgi:hypothetical protein